MIISSLISEYLPHISMFLGGIGVLIYTYVKGHSSGKAKGDRKLQEMEIIAKDKIIEEQRKRIEDEKRIDNLINHLPDSFRN